MAIVMNSGEEDAMKRVSRDAPPRYTFDGTLAPVVMVSQDEDFVVETQDNNARIAKEDSIIQLFADKLMEDTVPNAITTLWNGWWMSTV
jgi:heptaprenylglyceryl phosphate synthase